jgi:mRNA interferase MazF
MPNPKRGEIWQVQFDPALTSEGAGEHPSIIFSIDKLNDSKMPLTTVMMLTSVQPKREGMLNVRLEPDGQNGLTKTSWAQPHIFRAMNKEQRLIRRRGVLAISDFERVESALREVLGL